jgi:hypothetical protein
VALIFDKVLTFFSGMNAVALSPGGDLAAVCFHDRELHVYRIVKPSPTSKRRSGDRDAAGSLEEYRFVRLAQGRYNRPPEAEVHAARNQNAAPVKFSDWFGKINPCLTLRQRKSVNALFLQHADQHVLKGVV